MNTTTRPRVLIIGCGFGGLEATRALSRADVDITLIDRTNHHLFQPLLYQVATAGLSAPAISAPIRHVLRREMRRGNLTVLLAEVSDIAADRREVVLDDGTCLGYDHLIVAAGATHSYFGQDHWAAHAPGLKTLADAFDLRNRVLKAFEQAERHPLAREEWLSFVVIGAGPTGVEMAGTMAEIARHTLPDEFRNIDSRRARVLLVEGADRVLTAFEPGLSEKARRQLEGLGVEVLTGCRVTGIDERAVRYETRDADGRVATHAVQARTVVWAAGVAASPLGRSLQRSAGASLDRAGRVVVEPDLSLAGHPEIQVIGDLASARSHPRQGEPTPVPGVSPGAKQMGRLAAANLVRRLRGQPTERFRYVDYGSLATIGRKAAVAQVEMPLLGAVRFSGFAAWAFWLFVHIYFLIGFRNRLMVMTDWAWAYFSFQRNARVVIERAPPAATAPAVADAHTAAPGPAATR